MASTPSAPTDRPGRVDSQFTVDRSHFERIEEHSHRIRNIQPLFPKADANCVYTIHENDIVVSDMTPEADRTDQYGYACVNGMGAVERSALGLTASVEEIKAAILSKVRFTGIALMKVAAIDRQPGQEVRVALNMFGPATVRAYKTVRAGQHVCLGLPNPEDMFDHRNLGPSARVSNKMPFVLLPYDPRGLGSKIQADLNMKILNPDGFRKNITGIRPPDPTRSLNKKENLLDCVMESYLTAVLCGVNVLIQTGCLDLPREDNFTNEEGAAANFSELFRAAGVNETNRRRKAENWSTNMSFFLGLTSRPGHTVEGQLTPEKARRYQQVRTCLMQAMFPAPNKSSTHARMKMGPNSVSDISLLVGFDPATGKFGARTEDGAANMAVLEGQLAWYQKSHYERHLLAMQAEIEERDRLVVGKCYRGGEAGGSIDIIVRGR